MFVDFHNHYIPPRFSQAVADAAPPGERARWAALAQRLADEDLLLRDIREGRLAARVVNTSPALIADAEGRVPQDTIVALNDALAELAARHPGRIHGLACVDGYDGERSAREVERAVRGLGLRGVFLDCARGELLLDAPQARPTLEAAAALGVPIFVHPVAPQPLTRQMAEYGLAGMLFARGTVNGACVIALLERGVFRDLPSLRIVVTGLAIGGLGLAAALSDRAVLRRHVYVDTNLPDAALVRACVELLGEEHVLAGSDSPINDWPLAERLSGAMREAGLSAGAQLAIASQNALRLLNAMP